MMDLTLSLLGETQARLNGKEIKNLSAQKAYALLFYLAVESNRAHRREFLAEMFWPERPQGFGRNNLKQTLSQLRKALGDRQANQPFILSSKKDLQFNSGSAHHIDVEQFEKHYFAVRNHPHQDLTTCDTCAQDLKSAAHLYQDDFLAGFSLADCPDFNEWVISKREYYRRNMAEILTRLTAYFEHKGDYKRAAGYAEKLVDLEPWSESSHRRLMELLSASGKRSAALKQYQRCRTMLAEEFDAQPTAETTALYESIKGHRAGKAARQQESSLPPPQHRESHTLEGNSNPGLGNWIRASFFISAIALAAIVYLAFYREHPSPADPTQTVEMTPQAAGGIEDNPAPPTGASAIDPSKQWTPDLNATPAILSDPEQLCLEGETLLYQEDFQDNQAQGWPEIDFQAQDWEIVALPQDHSNLAVQNPGTASSQIFHKQAIFSNAVFRVDFMFTGFGQPCFLWQSNNTAFEEKRGLVTDSDYSISFMGHGLIIERYTYPLPAAILLDQGFWIKPDVWHQLEISTYQGTLSVWLDGEKLLSYQDPDPLPPGTIGLGLEATREEGSMTYFDNLRVCQLSKPFVPAVAPGD